MIPVQELYAQAEAEGIPVCTYPLPVTHSLSLCREDGCAIAIDPAWQDGTRRERTALTHELGHCLTGSFYNRYAAVDSIRRHENRADKWAVRRLIPVEALDEAIALGCTELWQLADHFGVTEDFMKKAVCLHVYGNMASELYF